MSAASDFVIHQGDRQPKLQTTLCDAAGNPIDLTGRTVRFHMRPIDAAPGDEDTIDAAADLDDEANGVVSYSWAAGNTDVVGTFAIDWVVDPGTAGEQSYPGRDWNYVRVVAVSASAVHYVTTLRVREHLGVTQTDLYDAGINLAIAAASRQIEQKCGRHFWLEDAASARTFTAEAERVVVPDIGALAGLVVADDADGDGVYENTWTANDRTAARAYVTWPDDALTGSGEQRPVRHLDVIAGSFPTHRRGVQVTARWGWPQIPVDIVEATLLQAVRLFLRKDAPAGLAGPTEVGFTQWPRRDADVEALIAPYRIVGMA